MTSVSYKDQKTMPAPAGVTPPAVKFMVPAAKFVVPAAPSDLKVGTMVEYDGKREHFVTAVHYNINSGWLFTIAQFPNCDTSKCRETLDVHPQFLRPTKELEHLQPSTEPTRMALLTYEFRNHWNSLMSGRMKQYNGKKKVQLIQITDDEILDQLPSPNKLRAPDKL